MHRATTDAWHTTLLYREVYISIRDNKAGQPLRQDRQIDHVLNVTQGDMAS